MASMKAGFAYACALLCASTTSFAQAPLPKEGTIALTSVFHSKFNRVAMGQELVGWHSDSTIGLVADTAEGFGDRVTGRCLTAGRLIKGKVEFEYGTCEFTDLAGDKFYTTLSFISANADSSAAKQTIVGGTGRYSGITGGWDVVRRQHPAPAAGEGVGSAKLTGTYKLP